MQVSRRHEFVEMLSCSRRPRDRYRSETERSRKMKWMAILSSLVCALATGCVSDNWNDAGGGTFAVQKKQRQEEVSSDNWNDAGGGTLAGTKWRLAAWSVSSLDPARFSITADFDESCISGTSVINRYSGSYTVTDDGAFSVGDHYLTALAGSADATRAEMLYSGLLRQARKYVVSGATLTLKDEGNHDILVFQAR